jgi:lysophospholipase L1-like esterase
LGAVSGSVTLIGHPSNTQFQGVVLTDGYQIPRFMAGQIAGASCTSWAGGYTTATASSAGATGRPNANLALLSYNGGFFSNQSICGYAVWTPSLTAAEMKELSNFFDAANLGLYRLGWQPSYVAIGDSNTSGGIGGVTSAQRYGAIVAKSLTATEDNRGVSGSTMSAADNGGSTARWVATKQRDSTINRAGAFYTVMLGTNDDRFAVPAASFASDYETWLNYQFSAGFDPSQFILISPIAATDALSSASRQREFGRTVAALAARYGCGFFDAYPVTSQSPTYFQADLLHLNATGHTALANGLLGYIASQMSATTVRRTAS